ncbi:MAG: hypothetical protein ACOX5R_11735 [bacterium]
MNLHPCLSCAFKDEWHRKKFQQKELQPLQQDLLTYLYIACSHKRDGVTVYSTWLSNPSLISTFQLYNPADERKLQTSARRLIEKGLITGYESDAKGNLQEIIPLSLRWEEKAPIQRITLTEAGVNLAKSFPQYAEAPENAKRKQTTCLHQSLSIFLNALFGNSGIAKGKLVLLCPQHNKTIYLTVDDLSAVEETVLDLSSEQDVLIGLGIHKETPLSETRKPTSIAALPGFWLDVGMPNADLDSSQAHTFLETIWAWGDSLSLRPSMAVAFGSRLQLYWLFETPWVLNHPEERERAQALSINFQKTLRRFTQEYYWDSPDTSSISHFMRLPGTSQHIASRRIPVILFKYREERRYMPHDFEFPIEPMRHVKKTALQEVLEELRQIMQTIRHHDLPLNRSQDYDEDENESDDPLYQERAELVRTIFQHSAEQRERQSTEIHESVSAVPPVSTAVHNQPAPYSYVSEQPIATPYVQKQEELLIEMANELELFHTSNHISYAVIPMKDHSECHPIHSKTVRNYLAYQYFQRYGRTAEYQALQEAVHFLEIREKMTGREQEIFTRVARDEQNLYLDLSNRKGEIIRITPHGWDVVLDAPVRFRRPRGMLSLPVPLPGGSVYILRKYINVATEFDFKLIVGWLLEALRCEHPKPILVLQGDNGSAKTITSRIITALLDPTVMGVQAPAASKEELNHSIRNSWILAYDNLSLIPKWMSDTLCRIATGSGFLTNQTDALEEEVPTHILRPILINGLRIDTNKSDLRDRVITVTLPPIQEKDRREEKELWSAFQNDAPFILGALLDAACAALANEDQVQLSQKPRLVDFVKWASAAETALGWEHESFLNAYLHNRMQKDETVLETDTVASALMDFIQTYPFWEGSAQELLDQIKEFASEKERQSRKWPDSPRSLTNRLRKLEPTLKALGVEVQFPETSVWVAKEGRTKRILHITNHNCKTPHEEASLTA